MRCSDYSSLIHSRSDAIAHQIQFRARNGNRLYGLYFQRQNHFTTLIHHSQRGNLLTNAWLANALLDAHSSVFIYDYQGYGKSEGVASVDNMLSDAEAAYDWVISELGVPPSRLVVCGDQLGCAAAMHVVERNPVAKVLGINPVPDFERLAKSEAPWFSLYPFFRPSYETEIPAVLPYPTLVLHPSEPLSDSDKLQIRRFIKER
jgi:pimeloyl-ACP methyl ester carboxylesterase